MKRILLAALLLGSSPTPSPATLNLPMPLHDCAFILGASGLVGQKLTTDGVGHIYATALKAQGVGDHSTIQLQQMVQAFSDMMGCFVVPKPSPTPKK